MTHFRLEKSTTASSHSSVTRFNVFNARGDIIGSINVPPDEEQDLLTHWRSSAPAPARAAATPRAAGKKENPMIAALLNASRRNGPLTRAAILRAC